MTRTAQAEKMTFGPGFVAALDQSGGSTPKALSLYGIDENAYNSDDEMFNLIHQMRCRIMQSPAFNGDKVIGAILFENTMDREVAGKPAADFLWGERGVVPFLKVDKGLADETDGVQILNPMPDLLQLLDKAKAKNVFGTKMRSVIKSANPNGIEQVVEQQFSIGKQIISMGLTPIIEPEVDIHSADKAEAESLLRQQLLTHLNSLSEKEMVIFKLTLPEENNFYEDCQKHPNLLRLVALSGGYPREEANRRLNANHSMIASFSRALTEGLNAQQSADEFNSMLDSSIQSIFDASRT